MTPLGTRSTLIEKPSSPPSVMYAVIGTGPAAVCAVMTWRLGAPGIRTVKPSPLTVAAGLPPALSLPSSAAARDEPRADHGGQHGEEQSATGSACANPLTSVAAALAKLSAR